MGMSFGSPIVGLNVRRLSQDKQTLQGILNSRTVKENFVPVHDQVLIFFSSCRCATTAFCQGKGIGSYCDGDTRISCRVDGRQGEHVCEDGCRTVSGKEVNINDLSNTMWHKLMALFSDDYAYCYIPPTCDYVSAPESDFQFCPKPSKPMKWMKKSSVFIQFLKHTVQFGCLCTV